MIYETPNEVAERMASFVPHSAINLIEPSVGNGALLKALVPRLKAPQGRIVAVDLNRAALNKCRRINFPVGWQKEMRNTDFLSMKLDGAFDCAIMNPPFASRAEEWVTATFGGEQFTCAIEAAFILKTLDALKARGRLIGLVPAGLINGEKHQWFRNELSNSGTIKIVHELPERTFHLADVKTYLVVFDKRKSIKPVRVLNHSINDPEQLLLESEQSRFDFAYHNAKNILKVLQENTPLKWRPLSEVAAVFRGTVATPQNSHAIHTTDYIDGFWHAHRRETVENSFRIAKCMDILVRRVSRNCATSFGILRYGFNSNATDCVLIIRPLREGLREKLLFSLRVFFGWKWARALVENGAGATFISQRALSATWIPTNLHQIERRNFLCYQDALRSMDFKMMEAVESATRTRLLSLNERNGERNDD